MGYRARNAEAWTDPFAGVLGAGRQEFSHLTPSGGGTSLAAFQPRDVQDLVGVLTNAALADGLRRSAAEQLTYLAGARNTNPHRASVSIPSMCALVH